MAEKLDQIFVTLKHLLMGYVPERWQPLASAVISIALIPVVFPGLFAIITIIVPLVVFLVFQRQFAAGAETRSGAKE